MWGLWGCSSGVKCVTVRPEILLRDWSLITGRGGAYKTGRGGAREVLPLRKGVGKKF